MNEVDQELARAWFRKAENDLLGARNNLTAKDIPYDVVCFHCQQAAEKYLKGFLAWSGYPFERTHDLERLVELCAESVPELSAIRDEANLLTDYAVGIRYPDSLDEPTPEQTNTALNAAMSIRQSVLKALLSKGFVPSMEQG